MSSKYIHGLGLFKTKLDEQMTCKHAKNWKILLFDLNVSRKCFCGILISWVSDHNRDSSKVLFRQNFCFKLRDLVANRVTIDL